ncbi:MAG: ATP-binding protein [Erythrobacter sp.]|uniref:ATP-binding protein n=1 Tax=Erythrobacter sp. TaxID=1042 RepID=UPI00326361EB
MEPTIRSEAQACPTAPASSRREEAIVDRLPQNQTQGFDTPFSGIKLHGLFARGDGLRSWFFGAGLGFVYFLAGILCLSIARFDATLASVWLPNAIAIAALFLMRLRNEFPVFVGIALASIAANMVFGTQLLTALVFTGANLANIFLVTWLTRRSCGALPDLSDLSHLGHFLRYGGVIGPVAGALIVAPAMGPDLVVIWQGVTAWFLVESLGIILIVPAFLLLAQLRVSPLPIARKGFLEAVLISAMGLGVVYLVFHHGSYPLLFLIPPITLLVAFRLGTLGTALFVPGVAIVASLASFAGLGPIAEGGLEKIAQVNLIQTFVAANFLTGLPIAAILAGRKRLTEALDKGQRELALLTEGITDAILMLNFDGVCTYASPSVADVLGSPAQHLVGQRFTDHTHEDAHERIMEVFAKLTRGQSDKERLTYRRQMDSTDGDPIFIEADCAVIKDKSSCKRTGIVMSARDVTERVELELLLTRARRSAEKAASAKSEFLANMSHEIRTPMNGVLGFAELMREGELSDENRRHVDMIVQSGRSMMMLLNDILDLSKIEAGQVGITDEPVDLVATISECADLYRPTAEKKGLKLKFSMASACSSLECDDDASGKSPWIRTDGLRLRQIILNLVGNAIKFTESGHVEIAMSSDEEAILVDIKDTGIGISEKRLKTIFAPFTQGESDTARRFGGTGLGLSISRQLAELLGGTIMVESKAGEGSSFRLTLPANYTRSPTREPRLDEPVDPSMITQSASILLVEDHDVNRLLASEMLERCGQSVAAAHDGNEAIAMVIDSIMRGKPFDLVLMDIQMPGCDGFAATKAIRMEGITPEDLPIIALTANAFPEDLAAARDAGMQTHLAKPLVFADLARALQRWLPTRIVAELESDQAPRTDTPLPEARDDLVRGAEARQAEAGGAQRSGEHPENVRADDLPKPTTEIVDISRSRSARPPKIGEIALPETQIENERSSSLSQFHSPSLIKRWTKRRSEAVEAVRIALEDGSLSDEGGSPENWDEIARLVHKLAGTAAIFGEAELGDQAAALEHALRMGLPSDVREALAFELLTVADDPADTLSKIGA